MTDQKLFLCTKERQLFEEVSNFYRDLIITKEKRVENLKRSNRMLENKIHKQRTELNRLNKENEDLKAENETLKAVREFNKGTIELLLERLNGKQLTKYESAITEHSSSITNALERGGNK